MLMVMSLFVGNLKDYQAKHFNQDGGIGQLMDELDKTEHTHPKNGLVVV